MAGEYDSGSIPASDDSSSIVEVCCELCATNLARDWPDLSAINPLDISKHADDEWRRAAELGCSFCNIVISVFDDAVEQHGCSSVAPLDATGFQVYLGPDGSTGRYLLALEHVMMPLLVEPSDGMKEFWGIITVPLDGKP